MKITTKTVQFSYNDFKRSFLSMALEQTEALAIRLAKSTCGNLENVQLVIVKKRIESLKKAIESLNQPENEDGKSTHDAR